MQWGWHYLTEQIAKSWGCSGDEVLGWNVKRYLNYACYLKDKNKLEANRK